MSYIKSGNIVVNNESAINGLYGFGNVPEQYKPHCLKIAESVVFEDKTREGNPITRSRITCNRVQSVDETNRLANLRLEIDLTGLFGIKLPVTEVNKEGKSVARWTQTFYFPEGDCSEFPDKATLTSGTWAQVKAMLANQKVLENFFSVEGRMLQDSKGEIFSSAYFEDGRLRNISAATVASNPLLVGFDPSASTISLTFAQTGYMVLGLASAINPKSKQQFTSVMVSCPEGYTAKTGILCVAMTGFGARSMNPNTGLNLGVNTESVANTNVADTKPESSLPEDALAALEALGI